MRMRVLGVIVARVAAVWFAAWPGDIYADGRNNLRDWAVFADWWMRDDCGVLNYYCEWADMDFSGDVGVEDMAELAGHWLRP